MTTTDIDPQDLYDIASHLDDALNIAADVPDPFQGPVVNVIQSIAVARLRELIDPPAKPREPAPEFALGRVTGRVRETVDVLPVGSWFTDKMGDHWEVIAEGLLKVTFSSGSTSRMFTVEAFDRWPWSFSEITLTKVGA